MTVSAALILALTSVAPAAASATMLDITIDGALPNGRVMGRIFTDAASFKARTGEVQRFSIEPNGGVVRTSISLPPGRYAMALFQDTRGTGRIETNVFGVPTVPYGFSNNARGMAGPPDFDAAAFVVGAAPVTLSVKLR